MSLTTIRLVDTFDASQMMIRGLISSLIVIVPNQKMNPRKVPERPRLQIPVHP